MLRGRPYHCGRPREAKPYSEGGSEHGPAPALGRQSRAHTGNWGELPPGTLRSEGRDVQTCGGFAPFWCGFHTAQQLCLLPAWVHPSMHTVGLPLPGGGRGRAAQRWCRSHLRCCGGGRADTQGMSVELRYPEQQRRPGAFPGRAGGCWVKKTR